MQEYPEIMLFHRSVVFLLAVFVPSVLSEFSPSAVELFDDTADLGHIRDACHRIIPPLLTL